MDQLTLHTTSPNFGSNTRLFHVVFGVVSSWVQMITVLSWTPTHHQPLAKEDTKDKEKENENENEWEKLESFWLIIGECDSVDSVDRVIVFDTWDPDAMVE